MAGSRSIGSEPGQESKARGLTIEGYRVEGLSIAGQQTCVIFPSLKSSFDIGYCPKRAVDQDFLFISHGHRDHSQGLVTYVETRDSYKMKPPTIIVPKCIKDSVEALFEAQREISQSELKNNLIGLDPGEEFHMSKNLKVKAFRTYHRIPSQGYVVYSVKKKLKQEYLGLPGTEIEELKSSGVEITDTLIEPQVAFTGDTTAEFILDSSNIDMLRAKILVMESTYLDESDSVNKARDRGHIHLSEIIDHAERFENKAILLIHFSPKYKVKKIQQAVSALPPPLAGRVFALTENSTSCISFASSCFLLFGSLCLLLLLWFQLHFR